jgi:hypothetical protein
MHQLKVNVLTMGLGHIFMFLLVDMKVWINQLVPTSLEISPFMGHCIFPGGWCYRVLKKIMFSDNFCISVE